MAVKGDTISDLPGVGNPATELPGGLFEVEVLTGPVAGAYVNKHLTAEQLALYLGAGTGGGSGILYGFTGQNTDGAMTQRAVTVALGFKLNADKLGQSLTRTDAIAAIAPHNGLTAGASYIVSGTWNNIPNSGVALLAGSTDNFNPVGYITISNNAVAVVADVKAGTYQLLSDLLGGFDAYEVSLAIRQAVVDGFAAQDAASNTSPFLNEPQPTGSLVGMEFVDPQNEYTYTFRPVGFANGTFNVWCSALLSR